MHPKHPNLPFLPPGCAPLCHTHQRTVPLDALVPAAITGINSGALLPLGDYGGDVLYYFTPTNNGLGSIKYTVFDRTTHIGLASFLVRYGAATTIRDIIFYQVGKTNIDLVYGILPKLNYDFPTPPGCVIPG